MADDTATNAQLDARVLEFNLAPAPEIDPSWLEADAYRGLLETLSDVPAASRWLSRYWIDGAELAGKYWMGFDGERRRLGLLGRDDLQFALLQMGASLCREQIQQIVDGAQRTGLRRSAGPEVIEFATQSAPLFGVPGDRELPDGFSEARFGLIAVGARELLDAAAMADPAYGVRVGWKLPHEVASVLRPEWIERAGEPQRPLPGYERRLLREIVTQWSALFD